MCWSFLLWKQFVTNVNFIAVGSIIYHVAWNPEAFIPFMGLTHSVAQRQWTQSPEQVSHPLRATDKGKCGIMTHKKLKVFPSKSRNTLKLVRPCV